MVWPRGSNQDKGEGLLDLQPQGPRLIIGKGNQTDLWQDQNTASISPTLSILLLWHHRTMDMADTEPGLMKQEIK